MSDSFANTLIRLRLAAKARHSLLHEGFTIVSQDDLASLLTRYDDFAARIAKAFGASKLNDFLHPTLTESRGPAKKTYTVVRSVTDKGPDVTHELAYVTEELLTPAERQQHGLAPVAPVQKERPYRVYRRIPGSRDGLQMVNVTEDELTVRERKDFHLPSRPFTPLSPPVSKRTACEHDWSLDGRGTNMDGSCTKCGKSFQSYIHNDCF